MLGKSWIWFGLVTTIVLVAAAVTLSLLTPPWPAEHGLPGPAWMLPVWVLIGLVIGAIALVVGLTIGAVALVIGLALGAVGLAIGLAFFAWPLALVALVVWLLVRDRKKAGPSPPTT